MLKSDCAFYEEYHDMGAVIPTCSCKKLGEIFNCESCTNYCLVRKTPHDAFTSFDCYYDEGVDYSGEDRYFCTSCYTDFKLDFEPTYCPSCGRKRIGS